MIEGIWKKKVVTYTSASSKSASHMPSPLRLCRRLLVTPITNKAPGGTTPPALVTIKRRHRHTSLNRRSEQTRVNQLRHHVTSLHFIFILASYLSQPYCPTLIHSSPTSNSDLPISLTLPFISLFLQSQFSWPFLLQFP